MEISSNRHTTAATAGVASLEWDDSNLLHEQPRFDFHLAEIDEFIPSRQQLDLSRVRYRDWAWSVSNRDHAPVGQSSIPARAASISLLMLPALRLRLARLPQDLPQCNLVHR